MNGGRLQETSTAEVLRQLAQQRATGCLHVVREGQQADVWFREGAVYTASAPEARPRLGDRLVGAGHLTQGQLDATLEDQRRRSDRRRIGELLIERGHIDRATMRAYVREQIADSVAVTLGWIEGDWSFAPNAEIGEDVPLDVSVENLLMEGARRLEEWEIIRLRLGSTDTIVDFVPTGGEAELSLTADEWSILTLIDGTTSIGDISLRSGYGLFETTRIIYGLLTAGVVRVVSEPHADPYEGLGADAAPAPPAGPDEPDRVDRDALLRQLADFNRDSVPPTDADEATPTEPRSPRQDPPPAPADEAENEQRSRRRLFGRFRRK